MNEPTDSWREVRAKAEALGLKLKLHLEQETSDDDTVSDDVDTVSSESTDRAAEAKAAMEDLADKLHDAFEGFETAAKDPAVRADVKDIGSLLKNALVDSFSSVSAEVGDTMKRATNRKRPDSSSDDA